MKIMRRSRVPIADKRTQESKKNHNSSQRRTTLSKPKVMRKNFSVNMVNTRSAKEHKTKESAVEGPTVEIDLETPDQSVDEVQRKQRNRHQCQMWKNKRRRRPSLHQLIL